VLFAGDGAGAGAGALGFGATVLRCFGASVL
jgi:hypothetical protein